jgi:peptidase E
MQVYLTSSLFCVIEAIQSHCFLTWKKIWCIWNASDHKWWAETYRNKLDRSSMEDKGAQCVDIDLRDWMEHVSELLEKVDMMFVWWWDTFYLAGLVKEQWLKAILRDFVVKWGIYIGQSAWSMLACDTVYFEKEGMVNEGLWFVDFSLIPHRGSSKFLDRRAAMFEDLYHHDTPYVLLTDRDFVYVHDDGFELIRDDTRTKKEIESEIERLEQNR